MKDIIPVERIENRVYLIRGQKVMLDRDLAELYGVKTFVLNQAVKRNLKRFPLDFMFQLRREELANLKSQIVMSSLPAVKAGWGGRRTLPYVFTQEGIAMLSSVLRSEKAIMVNIAIMRAFVKLRDLISSHKQLAQKISELEKKYGKHEVEITVLFKALKKLLEVDAEKPARKIGFARDKEDYEEHKK